MSISEGDGLTGLDAAREDLDRRLLMLVPRVQNGIEMTAFRPWSRERTRQSTNFICGWSIMGSTNGVRNIIHLWNIRQRDRRDIGLPPTSQSILNAGRESRATLIPHPISNSWNSNTTTGPYISSEEHCRSCAIHYLERLISKSHSSTGSKQSTCVPDLTDATWLTGSWSLKNAL